MNALTALKSRTAFLVAALAIGLSTTAAHAQYESDRVKFTAPFAFEYGSQKLPAGTYIVTKENPHITLIRGNSKSAMALTQLTDDRQTTVKGKIVFHRLSGRYFMSQVFIPGEASHITCNPSKAEKQLVVAQNNVAPTDVELALLELPR